MVAHASENEDCVLCFLIFCQKTTCLAKMIYINTKINEKICRNPAWNFWQAEIKLPHEIFDSLKETFFRPTACKFSNHESGNKAIF